MNYDQFIDAKTKTSPACGFEPKPIRHPLFDWQKSVVRWALRQGRAALFEDCGLGKTAQQLAWAEQVVAHTKAPVIILTPLAVARQTESEAVKFGIKAHVAESQADVAGSGIYITNYEKLEHFTPELFSGVVLDESSILKNFTGKTRIALTEAFSKTPYRLCCTATPSPNDYTEFGQHAAFLGICTPAQMLATFFINDTFNTGDWRLKGHAEDEFWKWLASWAACISKPSDIGFSDEGYILPALNMITEIVHVDESDHSGEELFRHSTLSATTMHKEMRLTSQARAERVASLVNPSKEPWIVWCNTNDEADKLAELIPDAVEVRGSDSTQKKEAAIAWFLDMPMTKQSLALIGKNDELAACGNPNTPPQEKKGIAPTKLNESEERTKAGAPRKTENTCATITAKTNTDGSGAPQNSRADTTLLGESSMRKAKPCAPRASSNQENGEGEIRAVTSSNESKNTGSQSINLKPCSSAKKEHAEFADTQTLRSGITSRSLTTAIQPEKSAGSSACPVIKASENSGTGQSYFAGLQTTCRKKVLISKSTIFGYGLNLQHCRNVAFVGLSYSFEDFYQALRRSYRFGQTKEVNAHLIQAHTEGAITQAIERKIQQHKTMQEKMKLAAKAFSENRIKEMKKNTALDVAEGQDWRLYHGDCVRVAKELPDESIDFSVFSPPFADLFTYSDDLQDMGNCRDVSEFTKHFEFLVAEMARVMVPGREVAVHCVDLLSTKWKHGKIEFQDFSGELIRCFWRHGFLFHSRICIWKSPVTEMQRTKAHGLLYKTLKADSTDSRIGCADYLLVFRKPGENPRPVTKDPAQFPVDWWQEVASPVWMTVDQSRVLNGEGAREQQDERHICPLQLDVIERAITLWSNPGDLVYSPFAGIGSEGYGALKLGRKFVGSELKRSYFEQACGNVKNALAQTEFVLR